ncbi:MAG: hypothetical protein GY804_14210 [Alphaproteobacteria bacterium]|nr:hypothetical protein [Alphaproteobacteria bacterium]
MDNCPTKEWAFNSRGVKIMVECCDMMKKVCCEKLDFHIEKTEMGISVNITTKDPSKAEAFKTMVMACKDFCGCCK